MLERLPTEVILKCVKRLELVDCMLLRATCKVFDKLVTAYLWRHVKIRIHRCRMGSRSGQCSVCCNTLYDHCDKNRWDSMNREVCCVFEDERDPDEGGYSHEMSPPSLKRMPAGLYDDDRWFLEYPLCDKTDYNSYLLQVMRRETFLHVFELHLLVESSNPCNRVISNIVKAFKSVSFQHNYLLNRLRVQAESPVIINLLERLQDLPRRNTDICINGTFSNMHILCELPHFATLGEKLTMLAFTELQLGGLTLDQIQILQTILARSPNLHALFFNCVQFSNQSANSPHLATLLTPIESQISSFSIYSHEDDIQQVRQILLNRTFPNLTFLQICPVVLELVLELLESNLLAFPNLETLNVATPHHQLCPKDNLSEVTTAIARLSQYPAQCPRLQTIVLLTHLFIPVVFPLNTSPYSVRGLNHHIYVPFSS
ncbi:hypothetical protein TRICI_001810 [Trichomonascus ciferrii]|uniref:F-box domain-containing protein n=1 Tax=Trichomonascus ciferrii TaxID=44093 RepID=A0A642VC68_9ASCO|nr:hypothetical protein TRICI_001810 [Trichomonascus ciferrii]